MEVQKSLNHKNLVKLIDHGHGGIIKKPSGKIIFIQYFILMEYVSGGTLFDLIESTGALNENTAKYFMRQILEALDYMEKEGVAHRDLKLENIMIDE